MNASKITKGPLKGVGKNKTGPYARKTGYMSSIEPGTSKFSLLPPQTKTPVPPSTSMPACNTQSSGSSIPSEYKLQQGKKKSDKVYN